MGVGGDPVLRPPGGRRGPSRRGAPVGRPCRWRRGTSRDAAGEADAPWRACPARETPDAAGETPDAAGEAPGPACAAECRDRDDATRPGRLAAAPDAELSTSERRFDPAAESIATLAAERGGPTPAGAGRRRRATRPGCPASCGRRNPAGQCRATRRGAVGSRLDEACSAAGPAGTRGRTGSREQAGGWLRDEARSRFPSGSGCRRGDPAGSHTTRTGREPARRADDEARVSSA